MNISKTQKYLLTVLAVIAIACISSLCITNEYSVSVYRTLVAPPNFVFNAINDLSTTKEWNHMASADTSFTIQYPGQTKGVNASCDFTSKMYGDGIIRVLSSNLVDSIEIGIEKIGQPKMHYSYKTILNVKGTSNISVIANTKVGFMSNLLIPIHKWRLKKQINRSLESLNSFVSSRFKDKIYNNYQIKEVAMNQKYFITQRAVVDFENINQFYTQTISNLYQKALENNLTIPGSPCALYFQWDEENKKADMAAALPTLAEIALKDTDATNLPPAIALSVEYKGNPANSAAAHLAIDDYLLDHELEQKPPLIEEYITDPTQQPNIDEWVTNIIYYVAPKK